MKDMLSREDRKHNPYSNPVRVAKPDVAKWQLKWRGEICLKCAQVTSVNEQGVCKKCFGKYAE